MKQRCFPGSHDGMIRHSFRQLRRSESAEAATYPFSAATYPLRHHCVGAARTRSSQTRAETRRPSSCIPREPREGGATGGCVTADWEELALGPGFVPGDPCKLAQAALWATLALGCLPRGRTHPHCRKHPLPRNGGRLVSLALASRRSTRCSRPWRRQARGRPRGGRGARGPDQLPLALIAPTEAAEYRSACLVHDDGRGGRGGAGRVRVAVHGRRRGLSARAQLRRPGQRGARKVEVDDSADFRARDAERWDQTR
eukprot:6173922-Pleurochrysis_carterae.AAC.1